MSVLRFLLLIFSFTVLLAACARSDLVRVRLLAPLSEAQKDHTVFTDKTSTTTRTTAEAPQTGGGSLYFVLKSIGFGYTALSTDIQKEVRKSTDNSIILKEKTTLKTNFTDLAFSLGQNYTLMWGVGILSGGKLDTALNYGYSGATDETLKHSYLGGHSRFMVFGHHGHGFETLLGIRSNDIKAELDVTGSSAQTLKTAGSVDFENTGLRLKTTQVMLGIGFTF